jgi:nucleoid DNA-binding protein
MIKKRNITKIDLARKITDNLTETEKASYQLTNQIITELFKEMSKGLKKGYTYEFRNFGTFKTKVRKARICRNPKTNGTVETKEHKVVSFKMGRDLKQSLKMD